MTLILQHINEMRKLCKLYNVKDLYVFGSVLSNKYKNDSHLDFLVEFNDISVMDYLDNFINFKNSLHNLYQRKIDFVEYRSIKSPILMRSFNRNKKKALWTKSRIKRDLRFRTKKLPSSVYGLPSIQT